METRNPLEIALELTTGPRKESYGPPEKNFADIAAGWQTILRKKHPDVTVSAEQVALMMIWLKICRYAHVADFDNVVDIAGYTNTLHMIREANKNA